MDYFRRRERRRLLEDLLDLEREEDIQRQCESIIHNQKRSENDQFDSENDDEEYKYYQHRRKEYYLVKLTYRNPNTDERQGNIDEIMIIQHNRIVFKGCLQDGDHFTFKSKRYRSGSKLQLKFFINDSLEDEMIGCCEHGLRNKNRDNHLFKIENIDGTKPCDECKVDENTSKISNAKEDSLTKEKKSTNSIPQIDNNKASASEGVYADITEVSDYHTEFRSKFNESNEESTDVLPTTPQSPSEREDDNNNQNQSDEKSPPKREYGPPQLSTMLSTTESLDTASPSIRDPIPGGAFNSLTNTQQRTASYANSNFDYNRSDSNLPSTTNERLARQPSVIEPNENEPGAPMSLNNSNEITMANDATQLLLSQLGFTRQEQVERPEVSNEAPLREKGNVEHFMLVYLHNSDPDESTKKHLRSLVNYLKIFNDADDCVAFINTIFNEKIILILSNSFYKSIIPRIEALQQLYTIYILSEQEDQVDLSSKKSKIHGSYKNINDIYEHILNDINKLSRDLVIYLNASSHALKIEPIVSYLLLLREIILDKNETRDDMKELINFSRQEYEGNDEELKIIDEFETTYQKDQAIYWYSRPCFISKMLNKGLRIPQPDILFRLRLFIQDLFYQMENESNSELITVYLGQTIQRKDLNDLQRNMFNHDIIIFPQFLFGSTDQSRATRIAKEIPPLNDNTIPLVIRIDIPEDIKCANINSHRYSADEDNNVLLNMGIMGRLSRVEKDNESESKIATVHMKLIKSNNQRNMQRILETTRAEIKSPSPFVSLIKLMIEMKQQTSAEKIVQTMFDDETLKSETIFQAAIAGAALVLAQSRRNQDDYQNALAFYLLSLDVFLRIIPANAPELSTIYSNIGAMYFRLENYEKSYEYFQISLENQFRSNTPDLISMSSFTNSIGIIYSKQGKYPEAIKSFERTLKILQQISEPHDAELAATHDDLGDALIAQAKYDEALTNYTKALELHEQVVPRNLQTLAASCQTIGNIYLKLGRSKEALEHLIRAIDYYRDILPLAHPTFALLYNNIGLMHYREQQYEDALKSYKKSLEISAIALPENHSLVGITLFNIGLLYSSQDKFDEAIETMEKSTEQFLKTLPPDHSDIMDNKKYIESIKQKKALKDIFDDHTTDL